MDLPPLEPFCGDWTAYIERIYQIYRETILKNNPKYRNFPVKPRYTPEVKGKHHGFWHLTSEGDKEDEREPCLFRCERIRWIRWLIDNLNQCAEISVWHETRNNTSEVVIWLESEDYVVVLSERRDYWLLKTAYLIKYDNKRKQLRKNREKYMKAGKS